MLNFSRKAGGVPRCIDIIPPERAVAVKPARHLFIDAGIVEDAEFEIVRAGDPPQPTAHFTRRAMPERRRKAAPAAGFMGSRFPRFFATYGFAVTVGLISAVTFWISGGHALAN